MAAAVNEPKSCQVVRKKAKPEPLCRCQSAECWVLIDRVTEVQLTVNARGVAFLCCTEFLFSFVLRFTNYLQNVPVFSELVAFARHVFDFSTTQMDLHLVHYKGKKVIYLLLGSFLMCTSLAVSYNKWDSSEKPSKTNKSNKVLSLTLCPLVMSSPPLHSPVPFLS